MRCEGSGAQGLRTGNWLCVLFAGKEAPAKRIEPHVKSEALILVLENGVAGVIRPQQRPRRNSKAWEAPIGQRWAQD